MAENSLKTVLKNSCNKIYPNWIYRSWYVLISLTILILIIWKVAVYAQGYGLPAAATSEQIYTNFQVVLDSIFLLFCASLAILINAGFCMIETGSADSRNAISCLSKNLIILPLVFFAFWAIGYGLMYGEGNYFMGTQGFFFNGSSVPYTGRESFILIGDVKVATSLSQYISFFFQVAFAAIPAAIFSGAVTERIKFSVFIIFSLFLVSIVYSITGHWVWDGGWLSELGFRDFAGSTVINSVGGWAALVGVLMIGPRIKHYQNENIIAFSGHYVSLVVLGYLFIWICWMGLNTGFTQTMNISVLHIAVTTSMAAVGGGLAGAITSRIHFGKYNPIIILKGVMASLVAISASCDSVKISWALEIGFIAGILVYFSIVVVKRLKLDDPLSVISVHLVGGIWGTLAVGIFNIENGLIFGGGFGQIIIQIWGVASIGIFTVILSFVVLGTIKRLVGIRITPDEENIGLDISQHGQEAYSGFLKEADIIRSQSGKSTSQSERRTKTTNWQLCIPITTFFVLAWTYVADAQGFGLPDSATQEQINTNFQVVLDSLFLLVAFLMLLFMYVGFGILQAGFCRHKNTVNILAQSIVTLVIVFLAYWSIGYGLMYGEGSSFIGTQGFFFNGSSIPYTGEESFVTVEGIKVATAVPEYILFLFQVAFVAITATIVSGAVAERVHFNALLIFSFFVSAICYPIIGHWVWDGGWLSEMGFSDFAGSTVVFSVGGWAALAGAAILGPRLGKYQEGRTNVFPGHNMSLATLGCFLIWFGWIGFNAGSELAATANVPYLAVTTNLAAAAGGVTSTFTSWIKDGKPDLVMIINGILAGLVSITAGCADVSVLSAIIIGGIAGIIVIYSVAFFDSIKIDDPVGAISVHLVCGIWGTLAVGIFGTGNLITQLIGIIVIGSFTLIFSGIVWSILKATIGLRVGLEEELQGLDIGEHGMEAYSDFVKEADIPSAAGRK